MSLRHGQSVSFLRNVVAHARQLETRHGAHQLRFHVERDVDRDGVRIGMKVPGRDPLWLFLATQMHEQDYTPFDELNQVARSYMRGQRETVEGGRLLLIESGDPL